MYREYLNIGIKAAYKAGKIVKKGFYSMKNIEFKSYADPVTEFDKKSEEIIVDTILKRYPKHSILTEELLSKDNKSEFKWVIDPIDGTINFTHQIPFTAISIALEHNNELVVGIVYNPIFDEMYYAYKGYGAYMNKKRISVSKISEKRKSLLVTGMPTFNKLRFPEFIKPLENFMQNYSGFRRLGSAAMDLVYVASGKFEAFYEEGLSPWDSAGGVVIVREAGGKVTDYYGNDYSIYNKTLIASNGLIHNDLVEVLKNVKPL